MQCFHVRALTASDVRIFSPSKTMPNSTPSSSLVSPSGPGTKISSSQKQRSPGHQLWASPVFTSSRVNSCRGSKKPQKYESHSWEKTEAAYKRADSLLYALRRQDSPGIHCQAGKLLPASRLDANMSQGSPAVQIHQPLLLYPDLQITIWSRWSGALAQLAPMCGNELLWRLAGQAAVTGVLHGLG
jgi:hypothetical protein